MKIRLFDTALSQIAVIAVGALVAAFLFIFIVLELHRPELMPEPHGPWPSALRAGAIAEALTAAPAGARPAIAAAMADERARVEPGTGLACDDVAETPHGKDLRLVAAAVLGERFGPLQFKDCRVSDDQTLKQIVLPDQSMTLVLPVDRERDRQLSQNFAVILPLAVGLAFLLIMLVSLSLWTLWRVNMPLREMATVIERFGRDAAEEGLPETGLREFRRLAQAYNRMQQRIAQLLAERSQMLMAIGHDLRTPLTRLKLRIELDGDRAPQAVLLRELDLMHRMIDGALSFLDDRHNREPIESVDLGALVESICLEFSDAGKPVSYVGGYGPTCPCQPTALTRAINNLIENACRYGQQVTADVRTETGLAVIDIEDDGPGIPMTMRDAVLAPFARLDAARASDGGLGLGLAIVRDVVRRHGGRLSLGDRAPQGLAVRVELPLPP